MRIRVGIGALAVVLVLLGWWAGASSAEDAGISNAQEAGPGQAQAVELIYGELVSETSYPLADGSGDRSAVMDLFKGRLLDRDGTIVGTHRCECVLARGYGWTCTHIYSLREGPFTDRGTVIVRGVFRGFSGESVAIIGGTGAYAGARGYAVATTEDRRFVHTLFLLP